LSAGNEIAGIISFLGCLGKTALDVKMDLPSQERMDQMDRSSNAHICELNQRIRSLERLLEDASKEARFSPFAPTFAKKHARW
jgi:hypothetical protein